MAKEVIQASLHKDKIIAENAITLYNRGCFGSPKGEILELSLYEAFYLFEKGKIEIFSNGKKLTRQGLLRKFKKICKNFWNKYLVYSDLRTRGYILKEALKYGADFIVYDKGDKPGKAHSKWLLSIFSVNDMIDWRQFAGFNRISHSVKKDSLIAIVDNQGEIVYYISKWFRP